jgi:hypothetical protein
VTHLLCSDSDGTGTSKYDSAVKKGITVINEDDFNDMFSGKGGKGKSLQEKYPEVNKALPSKPAWIPKTKDEDGSIFACKFAGTPYLHPGTVMKTQID